MPSVAIADGPHESLYVESSAVLSWLLGEPRAADMESLLANTNHVVSSDLTLVESDRVLHRARALGNLTEADATDLRRRLAATASSWSILRVTSSIVQRAREPFPEEPRRTLDALHVASALQARTAIPDVAMLSLDDRTRRVSLALGLTVLPN
jgi:predicted nucleic acid-binding protein